MSTLPHAARSAESIRLAHEAVADLSRFDPPLQTTADCLHALIDEAGEDYALGQVPSPVAIAAFGRVLQQIKCLNVPAVSLTPSGGIWAEWSDAIRRSIAVFVGQDGRARLGAVLMVQETCRLPLLLEFEGDVECILDRLRTDHDLRWVRESGA